MKQFKNVNHGVIIEKPEVSDFLLGALEIERVNESGIWPLPTGEKQKLNRFDSYACVTESATSSCESQLIWQLNNTYFPIFVRKWLEDNGYFDENGLCNFSDRYIAKLSGTIPNRGNTPKKVWDAIRHYGLVPEKDWPVWEDMQQSEFYAEVPQSVKDKGAEFLKYFDIQYEWMYGAGTPTEAHNLPFKKHFVQAPIQTITACCVPWSYGIIPACPSQPTHATLAVGITVSSLNILDSYEPFPKKLSPDYQIWQAMKGVIRVKTTEIKEDAVRRLWCARADLQLAYPSPTYINPSDPDDNRGKWAYNFGQWENREFFEPEYQGKDVVLQVEPTNFYYLFGGKPKALTQDEVDKLSAEVKQISIEEAHELGLDLQTGKEVFPLKKTLLTKLLEFIISLFK